MRAEALPKQLDSLGLGYRSQLHVQNTRGSCLSGLCGPGGLLELYMHECKKIHPVLAEAEKPLNWPCHDQCFSGLHQIAWCSPAACPPSFGMSLYKALNACSMCKDFSTESKTRWLLQHQCISLQGVHSSLRMQLAGK